MFCRKCGKEIPPGTKFCRYCGQPQETGYSPDVPEPPVKKPKKGKGILVVLIVILLAAALAAGVILFLSGRKGIEDDQDSASSGGTAKTEDTKDEDDTGETEETEEGYRIELDTSGFPIVHIRVDGKDVDELKDTKPEELILTEDNTQMEVLTVEYAEDGLDITYLSDNRQASGAEREMELRTTSGDKIIVAEDKIQYQEPTLSHASMSLISSDATEYPLVHAYVRVEDAAGNSIPGMSAQNFVIQEQLQGGQYLMAEISQAEVLNQNAALNTSMVVDKSGSISEEDMGKIKTVMTQFVDELQFTSGDKAEIISIDDIVRQMCLYTSNAEYLKNGINSMFPEGMTAFYDGVYQGIQQSLYQVGARCVIAFTDGLDNASVHSYQDVINYATAYSVPVYIIGVGGSVDEATLRLVAESTGGQYWYIDDLYSLEEIYRSIYKEQKEMYQITYTSRSGLGASDPRMMRICAVNDQYIAVDEEEVTPYVVDAVQIQTHASRYELVRSDASWEQASQEALAKGGHLVTISSQDEMNQVTQIAQNSGLTYVWLGGYTSYDANGQVFGHWTTGEPFTYQNWCAGEPSRTDKDGVQEWYIMLWNIPSLGGWNWNDQRNDPAADYSYFKGKMGYIIEYEE